MIKRLLWVTLLAILPFPAFAQTATPQAPNALGSATAWSDATQLYVCQSSGGCDLSGSRPLVTGTALQITNYIAAETMTMTNKTLTSPIINGAALSGTLSGNAVFSGTINFTGPLQVGGNVMTFPASAATIPGLNLPQTWTGVQTFNNGNIRILGGGSGYTTLSSNNSGTTNYTILIPNASDTIDLIGTAQNITAAKTFNNNTILIQGGGSGTTALASANGGSTNYTITFPVPATATDIVDLLGTAQTFTAQKTFSVAPSMTSIINTGTLSLPNTTGTLLESAGSNVLGGTYNLTGTFQANGNVQTFPTSAATLAALGTAQIWTAQQNYTSSIDITNSALLIEVPNNATATVINHLASLTGSPATATITPIGATDILGIVTAGAGASGNAQIARSGQASCAFDGPTTGSDYVQPSPTVIGDCHDTGSATPPTSGPVAGRVITSNASAGTYAIVVSAGSVGGGGAGATTFVAAPGLGNSQTLFNGTGAAQTIANGNTLYPQAASYSVTAAYTINAITGITPCTSGVLCDTARTILANGSSSIAITAPAPNGTLTPYSVADQAGFGFTVTSSGTGTTFSGCGTGSTITVPANYGTYIYDLGATANKYFCIDQPLTPISTPITLSWAPGQSLQISPTNVGIGLYTLNSPRTLVSISCRVEKAVGINSDTIAVWYAPTLTQLNSGTSLTSTTCNANGTAFSNQTGLITAPVVIPANNTIGIVASGPDWGTSAGAGSISVTLQ